MRALILRVHYIENGVIFGNTWCNAISKCIFIWLTIIFLMNMNNRNIILLMRRKLLENGLDSPPFCHWTRTSKLSHVFYDNNNTPANILLIGHDCSSNEPLDVASKKKASRQAYELMGSYQLQTNRVQWRYIHFNVAALVLVVINISRITTVVFFLKYI